jgi:hypothetical protein
MARIRKYMGRVEVWLDDRERESLLSVVDTLAAQKREGGRLEVHAYDDPKLEGEFQRLTRPEVDAVRQADLDCLRADLGDASPVRRLDEDRALTWLRALNVLRLAAAERLGIDDDGWEERVDPETIDAEQYAMLIDLGWVQQEIVEALEA